MESQTEQRTRLLQQIFDVNETSFEYLSLQIWHYQHKYNIVYREYCQSLGKGTPKTLQEIPFLPIQFFKSHQITCNTEYELLFKSSATTGSVRSNHFVFDANVYKDSFLKTYEKSIGNPKDQIIFALLPSYVSQGESSLVYMVDKLIQLTQNDVSGFYLDNNEALIAQLQQHKNTGKKIVLFGVSYALLDLAELAPDLSSVLIIETGGMKGRRKEISKNELHTELKNSFNVSHIASEYGMTELLSQGYSIENELFTTPNWMKILFRQVNDSFSYAVQGATGGINVIDLANIDSCAFIETQDLGKAQAHGFLLMGRFDHSDVRGCNLLIQ
jgi:hypothetical protein